MAVFLERFSLLVGEVLDNYGDVAHAFSVLCGYGYGLAESNSGGFRQVLENVRMGIRRP